MIITHTHAKNRDQKSVDSKDRVKSGNERTDTTDWITFSAKAVDNKLIKFFKNIGISCSRKWPVKLQTIEERELVLIGRRNVLDTA